MDISLLTKPAEKRLDLTGVTGEEGDFVTLRLWPMERRAKIESERTNGMDVGKFAEIVTKYPDVDFTSKEAIGDLLKKDHSLLATINSNPNFDGGLGYLLSALEYGVDDEAHSFTRKGKKFPLSRDTWSAMVKSHEGMKVCRLVLTECEKYQMEMSLKN